MTRRTAADYDVLVLGEVLVEIHAGTTLREAADGTPARISYSGDALNAAAAAAAAGARTALLAVVGDDELSVPLLRRAAELGVDVSHVRRAPHPNGAYLLTGRTEARELLTRIAPLTGLLKTSCPADAQALVGTSEPRQAAARLRVLGAPTVAVTAGAGRLLLDDGRGAEYHPVPVNPAPVDATGAGDCFTGTATARLVLGDRLDDARSAMPSSVAAFWSPERAAWRARATVRALFRTKRSSLADAGPGRLRGFANHCR